MRLIKEYHECKLCCICKKELTLGTVYGGFMGFFCRVFGLGKDWQKFSSCQKCRDYAQFFSVEEIIEHTDRWNKHIRK